MAKNAKNKFPADKSGSKYSEFRNTKRVAPGKVKAEKEAKVAKQASSEQSAGNAQTG